MRLTRRGYAVAGVVAVAVVSASLFGARGLNAVAAPGAVALVYAAVQVWRFEPPSIDRELPGRGQQGETVTVELDVDLHRPYSARLVDAVPDGLEASGSEREVTLGSGPVSYDLLLRDRGRHALGPARVEARDVLGLVARTFDVEGETQLLVRPTVYPLAGPRADELVWRFGGGEDRRQFDFLRHYRRGDPLRDVHWRSSAKIPDGEFVVKEFSTGEAEQGVLVAGACESGHADAMAAATASIAVHLLAEGFRVGVAAGQWHLDARAGPDQRDRVLDGLGEARGGPLRDRDRREADVLVHAGPDGVAVELADATVPFTEVVGRSVSLPDDGGAGGRPEGVA